MPLRALAALFAVALAAPMVIRKAEADYLGYAILDTIFDGYFPVLEGIGDELETLEELVLTDPTPSTLRQINRVKNMLIVLRRLVWPQRDALNRLVRDPHPIVKKRTLPYFRATFDQCAQAVELLEALREWNHVPEGGNPAHVALGTGLLQALQDLVGVRHITGMMLAVVQLHDFS